MTGAIDLTFPFTGRWLTQNSPANRIPSHGTKLFATSYAIDVVPVDHADKTAPIRTRSLIRPEPADHFPGFGRPILAPIQGTVIATYDAAPDHAAYRGVPSLWYALTQSRRMARGWIALAGNYVLIQSADVVVAICHLQQDSIVVRHNQTIQTGDLLGLCGNSGNSTEPHVHLQAMDSSDPAQANAVRIAFQGELPRNGEIINGNG